jgi:hypothetical protein
MKAQRTAVVATALFIGAAGIVGAACSTSSSVGNGAAPPSGFVGLPASCSGNVYYELNSANGFCGGGPVYVLCGVTTYGDEYYCDASAIPGNYTSAGRQPFDGGPDASQSTNDASSHHDSGHDATAHDAHKPDAVAHDSGKHDAAEDAGKHDSGEDAGERDAGRDAARHDAAADARAHDAESADAARDAERG